jgi:hypothetical protein
MKFSFEAEDRVMSKNSPEHTGTVVQIENGTKSFWVQWDGQPKNSTPTPYPQSFADTHIVKIEHEFKNENNPNIAFKRRKPK